MQNQETADSPTELTQEMSDLIAKTFSADQLRWLRRDKREAEIAELAREVSADRLARIKEVGKGDIADVIVSNIELFISVEGRPLWTARAVGSLLVAKGRQRKVKGYDAFDDALGDKGLQLPRVVHGGRKAYDLSSFGLSTEEKEAAQVIFSSLEPALISQSIIDVVYEAEPEHVSVTEQKEGEE